MRHTTDEDRLRLRRSLAPDDLSALRFVMGADMSADGTSVVYVLSRLDLDANAELTDLFLLDVVSGEQRRLTETVGIHLGPRLSPDGSQVAFMAASGGPPQLHVLSLAGGDPRPITELPGGVGGGPVWSPDGTRLAFTAGPPRAPRDPSRPYRVTRPVWRAEPFGLVDDAVQDIYVVPASGGPPARLTDDEWLNVNPAWTHDGSGVVYTAAYDPGSNSPTQRLRHAAVAEATDAVVPVITELADGGMFTHVATCSDGRVAYILASEDDRLLGTKADLWVLDPASGFRERRTASLDVGVGGTIQPDMPTIAQLLAPDRLVVSDDAGYAFAPVQRGGEMGVYRIALSGPEACQPLVTGSRVALPAAIGGGEVLFLGSGIFEPGNLYLVRDDGSAERQLTDLNGDLLHQLAPPTVHRLEFPSADGAMVEGWFLEPSDGTGPYPTVLGIHGGPHLGWGYTFNFDCQMLCGAGFGVLLVNHRGSTGYGTEFATATNGDWGNLDAADLIAGVDLAIARGLADGDRLGVFGMSAGGGLTGWLIGHTARFKAACTENPVFNWVSIYGTSDVGVYAGHKELGGAPHERAAAYARCSPITYAHRCTTPTLLLQHESDCRSPAEQSEQFYAVLKTNGVPAEMLRFPGTSHFGSMAGPPSHRLAQNDALLDWMTRYVLAKDSGAEEAQAVETN